ncbi:MAG: asparagine synthase (glutamine-hydrolyzing) [Phycisphaerales bacterium]|nr:asparagine synthase (glutamine-hydrolyzing) [Phycisphaerales bacterium]
MCGICGIVGKIKESDDKRVATAMKAILHRGPDGHGLWQSTKDNNNYGAILAHTRLSIIDLREVSSQPMVDEKTGVCLVFNGEIYNFKEIKKKLEDEGNSFLSTGDSEVILRGYLTWGDSIVSKLRGMFAFVIFDPRNERAIFGRDGFGIKPLYTTTINDGKAIAFSSEVRSLLKAGFASPITNTARVHSYLWNGFIPAPMTLIRDVNEFPRGSLGLFDKSDINISITNFWNSSPKKGEATTVENAAQELRRCVRSHLYTDVPMGIFLSGGIDSSAIAIMATESEQEIKTLTIGFNEQKSDESVYAEAIASKINSIHQTVKVTSNEMLCDIDNAISALDQPSFDGINNWFVSRAAIQSGLTVALAGTGGDELLGGYKSFARIPMLMRLAKWIKWSSCFVSCIPSWVFGNKYSINAKIKLLPKAIDCPVKLYQLQYALFSPQVINSLLNEKSTLNKTWGLAPDRFTNLQRLVSNLSPLQTTSTLESELFLGDRLLRDTDSVSMAHGLEIRVPLVDTFLSDELSKLPDHLRFQKLGSKHLLRSIAEATVGKDAFDRPKQGFEFPFDEWIRTSLKHEVASVLLNKSWNNAIGLNPIAVEHIWHQFLGQPGTIYWTRIWAIYTLLKWCDNHNVKTESQVLQRFF